MSNCVNVCAPALCASLLASVVVPFASARADDCLTEPTRAATAGSHWFYHMDPATNRKCWFLVGTGARPPAAPPGAQPPAPDSGSLDFGSLFSWWTAGSSTPATPPDSATTPEARPTGESRARPPRQMGAQAAPQAALTPKPHRPAAAHVPTAHGDEHVPLTDQERDALFQDFLRWKDSKKPQ